MLKNIIGTTCQAKYKIYNDNNLYGHLDFQKETIEPRIDGYIGTCNDIYFDDTLLYYMIESVKQIKNTKCFIITPQIYKM